MRMLTLRALLERESILQLLKEPEFAHNVSLGMVKDNFAKCDHYLGIFVFTAESHEDGRLRLRAASTTVLGVQRFTTKRLVFQDVDVNPNFAESEILMETLRAHYRAAQRDTFERINSIGTHQMAALPPFEQVFREMRRTFRQAKLR